MPGQVAAHLFSTHAVMQYVLVRSETSTKNVFHPLAAACITFYCMANAYMLCQDALLRRMIYASHAQIVQPMASSHS